jgi:hypothetical protein
LLAISFRFFSGFGKKGAAVLRPYKSATQYQYRVAGSPLTETASLT